MASNDGLTAILKCGLTIQGSESATLKDQRFIAFKGIPYAEPPTGNLRFKPPVPKVWTTTHFDATRDEIESLQNDITNNVTGQEDCLVLNVYTQKTQAKKIPVIVYIHGGGFNTGSGIMHGPRKLLDQDVVLVTINYRLHVFGFLSTMDKASPGNYGLLDQILALQWVRDNIEVFGGDPNCVTAIGHSAGAGCLMHLMLSPLAKDLFHRVVLMSGNSLCSWTLKRNPKPWTIKLARAAECDSSNSVEIVDYLRKLPALKLLEIHTKLCKEVLIPMNPVIDGHVLPDDPLILLEKGLIVNKVPVLIGLTKDEGLLFLPVLTKLSGGMPYLEMISTGTALPLLMKKECISTETRELVRNRYFKSIGPKDEDLFHNALAKVFSDAAFVTPHYKSIGSFVNAGIQTFVYSSDYQAEYGLAIPRGVDTIRGVGHGDDLYSLFDCRKMFPFHCEIPNNITEDTFLQVWTNFVQFGIPSHNTSSGRIDWTPATPESVKIYHLNDPITIQAVKLNDFTSDVDFWFKQIPATIISEENVSKL